jgi:6-phosphofructokinase 1
MFKVLAAHDVRYFFYIGGNDSAETTHIVQQVALENHYPLHVFHIPKTIDNDLRGTDHSPGFGSAAKFVAQAFMGDDMDNRSLKGIKIDVVMGRGAGFLTAASALGRARADSGPHLIYVPEVAFDEKRFLADVKRVYAKLGRCVIAVSEGIRDRAGVLIAKEFSQEVDSHGNAQLSGSGAMGDYLAGVIKRKLGNDLRVRADTFGYLQRSFAGVWSETDVEEARRVGEFAVANAATGAPSGTVSMIRHRGKKYAIDYKLSPLSLVARETTELPRRFLNKDGNNVTRAFIDYALPLVGHLPRIGFLEGKPVKKWKLR